MPLIYLPYIRRSDLRAAPDTLFVFGDNLARRGFGGQAREMRGEPNAVGVPTKYRPSNDPDAYFSDDDFTIVKSHIDDALIPVADHILSGGDVVWPLDGIGSGRARLPTHAPRIWSYLEGCRLRLQALSDFCPLSG